MNQEALIEDIVRKILSETVNSKNSHKKNSDENTVNSGNDRIIPDISKLSGEAELFVPNPHDPEMLLKMKKATPARIGVYRAGSRYKTKTLLKFRSDHAVSMDAVFNEVSEDFLKKLHLETVVTKCSDKNEYLTRPDLGKVFDDAETAKIRSIVGVSPNVLIYASDGLSSTAVEDNLENILPVILEGVKLAGLTVSTPFFVKHGRVPAMDAIGEITGADVVCTLIGERPGLVTAGSMSAYMAYKPTVGMPEARRSVISNIHKDGLPPAEAGAHIAELLVKMFKNKASGLDLRL